MTKQEKRKGSGGRLARSETVTVRLDPKLRYLAELAARKQRRTLSSFIEWAIEESLNRVHLREGSGYNDPDTSVADQAAQLWDVDDPDRFAKLAVLYPEMLTHEEQILWKLIRENGYLWRGRYHKSTNEWIWDTKEENLIFERLRKHWDIFNAVARGEADKSELPNRIVDKKPQNSSEETGFDEFDDDIPF